MIEQVRSRAKYYIILFRYVLNKYRKSRIYISKISHLFDIFVLFRQIKTFPITDHSTHDVFNNILFIVLSIQF